MWLPGTTAGARPLSAAHRFGEMEAVLGGGAKITKPSASAPEGSVLVVGKVAKNAANDANLLDVIVFGPRAARSAPRAAALIAAQAEATSAELSDSEVRYRALIGV